MPELPEVETIRQDLASRLLNKKISKVEIGKKRIVKNSVKIFVKILTGNKFTAIDRIGKLLIFHLQTGGFLLVHLKMTGQLIYCHLGKFIAGGHSLPKIGLELPNKYSHVIFSFADGDRLFFNDMRQFGYLEIVTAQQLEKVKARFGMEPLTPNFKLAELTKILQKRTAPTKTVLLNQQLIAGIGNIYADEILFAARILPTRQANSLNDKEIKNIFLASKKILAMAIKHRGTTFNDYVDAQGNVGSFVKFLKVYGKKGVKCPRCGGVIKKIKMGGRGTHFCLSCQK
jgi:formamidopyrimidine-DNA glycosylase